MDTSVRRSRLIFSTIFFFCNLIFLILSFMLKQEKQTALHVAPTYMFPIIMSTGGVIFSIIAIFQEIIPKEYLPSFLKGGVISENLSRTVTEKNIEEHPEINRMPWIQMMVFIILTFLAVLLLERLGMVLDLGLYLIFSLVILGEKRMITIAGICLGMTLFMYVVFIYWLSLPLPAWPT